MREGQVSLQHSRVMNCKWGLFNLKEGKMRVITIIAVNTGTLFPIKTILVNLLSVHCSLKSGVSQKILEGCRVRLDLRVHRWDALKHLWEEMVIISELFTVTSPVGRTMTFLFKKRLQWARTLKRSLCSVHFRNSLIILWWGGWSMWPMRWNWGNWILLTWRRGKCGRIW